MGTEKRIFGRFWNKVVVNLLFGFIMLAIILIQALRFEEVKMPSSLVGIAIGLLLINGCEWWNHGTE